MACCHTRGAARSADITIVRWHRKREPSSDPIMLPYNNALAYLGGSYKDVLWAPWLITLRGRRSVRFNDAFPIVGFRVVRTR